MSAVLDVDLFYVPMDSSNREVARAFACDDPNVIRRAQREQCAELSSVIRGVLHWFIETPMPQERLADDVLGSVFGLRIRQGMTDDVLAQQHRLTLEDFERQKADLVRQLGLRPVTAEELSAQS